MKSVIFDERFTEEELLEKLSKCNNNVNGYITSNCLLKASIGDFFIKKLNAGKIRELYQGDYLDLFKEYYSKVRKLVHTNQIIGLVENDGELYEFSKLLINECLLDDANIFEWKDIKELFNKVLDYINNCVRYNKEKNELIGFETAIWNFTIEGILFDLDPPKFIRKYEDSTFTRKEDESHIKRTIYRSFDETGMKLNLLVTLLLGEKHNSFIIKNKPKNYIDDLIDKIIKSFEEKEKCVKLLNQLEEGLSEKETFLNHPIELLRRERMIRENLKEKEIVFVGGTSESGKSGGINYILDNYSEVQHVKIRDVFPMVYEDALTNLSFEEWQEREERRDLNNFWRLFVNKHGEIVQEGKKVIILDTMYGVDGMIELYQILGENVHLLYIDAPFEERIMREYRRLRRDSERGTRKADLSITIEDIEKITAKKDAKKNKFGANKLPFLSFHGENFDRIEIDPNGERFTYFINNNKTLEDFYCELDIYMGIVLSKKQVKGQVKEKR